jgi:hypothetical protein
MNESGLSAPQSKSHELEWACIPQELRELKQWCFTSPNAASPKAPLTRGGRHASCRNPDTWLSFDEACACAKSVCGNIGFVLTEQDPYCCIDLDVKDDTPREWLDRQQQVVDGFASYTEWSTSGRGKHVWVRGSVGRGVRSQGIEVYSQDRFMICTGRAINGAEIEHRTEMLAALAAHLRSEVGCIVANAQAIGLPDPIEHTALVEKVAANPWLTRLAAGDYGDEFQSRSEADFALLMQLARLSGSDDACIAVFRGSALGQRSKAARDDYVSQTMMRARAAAAEDARYASIGREIAQTLLAAYEARQAQRFRLFTEQELSHLPPVRFVVKGLIPERGIGCIYGPSGSGKTFLTLDLLAHIANGQTWFGRRVRPKPVVYIPLEGQAGIPRRVAAWRANIQRLYGVAASSNIRFVLEGLDVRRPDDRTALINSLLAAGLQGAVICIDTLAQSAPGLEENSSEGMGGVLHALQDLERRLEGVVIVIHHTGKDPERGMRGWSGLQAAVDFSFQCVGPTKRNGERRAVAEKVKDGEAGFSLRFNTVKIHLGSDEDGEPVTSLAVVPVLNDVQDGGIDPAVQSDIDDDNFVWNWVVSESKLGNQPSANSLQSQLAEMAEQRRMSQARVRVSVHRLLAENRLRREPKGRHGNPYLVAVERLVHPPAPE